MNAQRFCRRMSPLRVAGARPKGSLGWRLAGASAAPPAPATLRTRQSRRGGFAIVGVMICFVVASMLVVSWLNSVTFERQQLRTAEERLQAEWLAEAALDRAAAKLSEKPDYAGETWNISADDLSGRDPAAVEIHVVAVAGHPDRRTIEVVADYPINPDHHARQSKQLIIDLNSANGKSGTTNTNSNKSDSGK